MYQNLKAEMARKAIKLNEMANFLCLSRNTLANKINGKAKFTLDEAFCIHEAFFEDLNFMYLFKRFNAKEVKETA